MEDGGGGVNGSMGGGGFMVFLVNSMKSVKKGKTILREIIA